MNIVFPTKLSLKKLYQPIFFKIRQALASAKCLPETTGSYALGPHPGKLFHQPAYFPHRTPSQIAFCCYFQSTFV